MQCRRGVISSYGPNYITTSSTFFIPIYLFFPEVGVIIHVTQQSQSTSLQCTDIVCRRHRSNHNVPTSCHNPHQTQTKPGHNMPYSKEKVSTPWTLNLQRWTERWMYIYFSCGSLKPVCLICSKTMALTSSSNVKYHYELKYGVLEQTYSQQSEVRACKTPKLNVE